MAWSGIMEHVNKEPLDTKQEIYKAFTGDTVKYFNESSHLKVN